MTERLSIIKDPNIIINDNTLQPNVAGQGSVNDKVAGELSNFKGYKGDPSQVSGQGSRTSENGENKEIEEPKTPLEKFCKTHGLENIDDAYAYLVNKENKTKQEQDMLDEINANRSTNLLVKPSEMLDEKFIKKPIKEKIAIVADRYYSKFDIEYNKKSDNEKKAFLENQALELAKSIHSNENEEFSEKELIKVPGLLQVLADKKMSIDDYNKLSKDEKIGLYRDHQIETMKKIRDLVPESERTSDKFKKLSADGKLRRYAEAYLTAFDPSFATKTEKEKNAIIGAKSNELLSQIIPNWQEKGNEKIKDGIKSAALITFNVLCDSGTSIDEFQNMKPQDKEALFSLYLKNIGGKDNKCQGMLLYLTVKLGRVPTVDDVKEHAYTLKDPKKRDEVLSYAEMLEKNNKGPRLKSLAIRAAENSTELSDVMATSLDAIEKEKSRPEKLAMAFDLLQLAGGESYEDLQKIKTALVELGIEEAEIDAMLKDDNTYAYVAAGAASQNKGQIVFACIANSNEIGDIEVAKNISSAAPISLSQDQSQQVGCCLSNDPALSETCLPSFTKSVNENISDPFEYLSQIVQNPEMSDLGKARYAQSSVEMASPEQQAMYGERSKEIEDPYVMKGMAAATNNVDASVRDTYRSNIESVIKNYPPETQAEIKEAMKTGSVESSEKTSSKNGTSNSKTSSSESSEKTSATKSTTTNTSSAASGSSGKGATSTTATNSTTKTTATTAPTTTAATTATTAATNKGVTASSGKTSDEIVKMFSELNEQKKTALMERIVDFILEKSNRTIEEAKAKGAEETATEETAAKVGSVSDSSETSTDKTQKTSKTEDISDDLELSSEEQDTIYEIVTEWFSNDSISAAYDKLTTVLGENAKDKFLEAFASKGRAEDIKSFATNNKGTIEKLIAHTSNDSLKLDLAEMLTTEQVSDLISKGKLPKDAMEKLFKLGKVSNDVYLSWLLDRLDEGAASSEILALAKNLPLDYQNMLLRDVKGSDSYYANILDAQWWRFGFKQGSYE